MKKRTTYTVDTIFVLVLFAVFTITVLFVLMSGAGVYKNTQTVMQERFEERTCLSYVTAKVNHYDKANSIYVTDFGGCNALAMDEVIAGDTYSTLIYCYEGQVKELMFRKDLELEPAAGKDITPAKSLEFTTEGNLVTVKCVGTTGHASTISLNVASGLEAQK